MKNAKIANNFGSAPMGQILSINWDTYVEEQAKQAIQYFARSAPGTYNLEQTTYRIYVPIGNGSGVSDEFYLVAKDDLSKSIKSESRISNKDLVFASCVRVGWVKIDPKTEMHLDNMEIQYFANPAEAPAADLSSLKGLWDGAYLSAEVNGSAGLLYKYSLKGSQRVPSVLPTEAGQQVATSCCDCVTNPILALCGNQEIKIKHKWPDAYTKPANADNNLYAVLEICGLTAKGCADKFCQGVDSHGNLFRCPVAPGVAVAASKRA